ncbi:MAG: enoyl-CoA hydratase/isomerase family protein [Alphaproteobacteria bacterium]|jgi:enoyl-CoA hydratase|nr:enoyl-CoA hydratase/isomerase family protein [Alphaproteobacteria bacterium]MDP6815583.1 enoyl-CoA hydratase/isomerase family protein [Alphaproteobacteria bacterium]
MTASEAAVLTDVVDGVGVMTLNRPDKFNCISSELMDGMQAAIEAFDADRRVRAVLIRGNGKVFCTGADLDEVMAARENQADMNAFIGRIHQVLRQLEESPLPVIAAVHGLALAGGIEIVLACDVVFAGESAKIGDQHAQYGLIPGGGGTQRLPRLVGLRRALDLMFTNRWLAAAEAERWGLVNYVTADDALAEAALDYCRALTKKSRSGLAAMKQLSRRGLEMSPSDGLSLEEREVCDGLRGDDVSEGLAAFQARREPNFP